MQLRDAVSQLGFTLRKGLDFAGFNLAFQVHGAEFGNLAAKNANFLAHLSVERAVRRISFCSELLCPFERIPLSRCRCLILQQEFPVI